MILLFLNGVARNHSRCRSDGEVLAAHLHKVHPGLTSAPALCFSCQAIEKVPVGLIVIINISEGGERHFKDFTGVRFFFFFFKIQRCYLILYEI